jgi:hypothetical protein
MKNCPDCNAKPGELHHHGCDVERCTFCGRQALSCGCWARQLGVPADDLDYEPTDEEWDVWQAKCEQQGRIPWTGVWPGIAECREYGLWCYQDPTHYGNPNMHYGHIPCDADHPNASEDLNRLYSECVWDRNQKKFVRKS